MIIKTLADVSFADLRGYEQVTKQIVIGPDDGSTELVMRYFSIAPGGTTAHHTHGFPHLVSIQAGSGVVMDARGVEHPLKKGDYLFISDDEAHHLANTGTEPFAFICVVPRRGEE